MRIERLSSNQFSIFLTFDDLIERGFITNNTWKDITSIQHLFSDMVYEASDELGIELEGTLQVHVYLMQAQGLHVTVTLLQSVHDWNDDYIQMNVTLDESKEMIFSFADFEHILQLSCKLSAMNITGGQIYYFEGEYYMLLEEEDILNCNQEDLIAVMSEYSCPSIITSHRLKEYGKPIFSSQAIMKIDEIFFNNGN
ncbi:adapter protein MecA [Compostibacillus humi]|uniref:Adapter protein MecA n=1 Tax=Compostibacillus humi TaxID=1245525 RepID=A0A8J3EJ46_9BACI|nr:genetic competence negative regulator [Compostibacillus humi]GGH68954.1 adapter protein MecA [Compostibacillus humi]